jgi:hypothetical protein
MLRYSDTYARKDLLEDNEVVCNIVRKAPKLLDAPVVNSDISAMKV